MSRNSRTNWQQEREQAWRNRDHEAEMIARGQSWAIASPHEGRKPGCDLIASLSRGQMIYALIKFLNMKTHSRYTRAELRKFNQDLEAMTNEELTERITRLRDSVPDYTFVMYITDAQERRGGGFF